MNSPEARTKCVQVALLHGNGGGRSRFQFLSRSPQTGINWVPLELPGFGQTPREPGFTSLRDYADSLLERVVVLERPRVLLGHGIGGSIALELIQYASDELDALILHAPVGAHLDRRLFPKLMKPRFMRKLLQGAITHRLLRRFWRRRLFTAPLPAAVEKEFFEDYRRGEAFGQMFDLINSAWFESLRPISLPSVVLWGESERVLSSGQAEAFQALLPTARIERIRGWDHFPMLDQPQHYAEVVARLATELTT